MESGKWLPLGSVISIKGSLRKLIILGRGLTINDDGEEVYYDYVGTMYPLGLTGEKVIYFNHSAVDNVLFVGYDDDDNRMACGLIDQYLREHPEIHRRSEV